MQVSDVLQKYQVAESPAPPPGGWVRAVRKALGMTHAQLGARAGVSRQTVLAMEGAEAARRITLDSLDRLAHAMDCRVVYALVPQGGSLDDLRARRANVRADELLGQTAHSMKLEAQGVSAEAVERQRKLLVETLLRGSSRKLWE